MRPVHNRTYDAVLARAFPFGALDLKATDDSTFDGVADAILSGFGAGAVSSRPIGIDVTACFGQAAPSTIDTFAKGLERRFLARVKAFLAQRGEEVLPADVRTGLEGLLRRVFVYVLTRYEPVLADDPPAVDSKPLAAALGEADRAPPPAKPSRG